MSDLDSVWGHLHLVFLSSGINTDVDTETSGLSRAAWLYNWNVCGTHGHLDPQYLQAHGCGKPLPVVCFCALVERGGAGGLPTVSTQS